MPFNGKRGYRKKRGFGKKRTYKKRGGVSRVIKSYVKRTIHSQIENKIEVASDNMLNIHPYAYSTSLFTRTCIPYTQIVQGVEQGGRIGNLLKTRFCFFTYTLSAAPYDVVYNPYPVPQEVMVFFGKVLAHKPTEPVAADYAKLYQSGDTSSAPQSNFLDLMLPLNKDVFKIYKVFRHKIGNAQYATGTTATQLWTNNDFKMNVVNRVNCTKWCPKTLKFNDTTNIPTNDGLYVWALTINANGLPSTDSRAVKLTFVNSYTYEDA